MSRPTIPSHRMNISVMGPLELRRDNQSVRHPDLRRQRVRELLSYLVSHGRARRECVAEQLWPHLDDAGHNLRVTLSYLQRLLQPDRSPGELPCFISADSVWLELIAGDNLAVDLWDLDAALDQAEYAARTGSPTVLDAYGRALDLWRGEPFADVPYASWAQVARETLRLRYTTAAIQAGELHLAAGRIAEVRNAAQHAIDADAWSEPAYRLIVRAHLAEGNTIGARRAIDTCRHALRDLDLQPEPATLDLVAVPR